MNYNCVLQSYRGKLIDIWCIMLGLSQRIRKELSGNVPRNVEKSSHYLMRKNLFPNSVTFQRIPPLTETIKRRRLKFIGYC